MNARCTAYGRFREPLTERHVQAIWYDREFRPERLLTRRGTPVRVIHPGVWNLEAGPDFKDAVLEIGTNGERRVGDVEVHLSPSDWTAHRHGKDPAYRNVIAHVTWGCGPEPETLPPDAVSVWLGRFVTTRTGFSPEDVDLSAYPFARLPSADRPCFERLRDEPDLALEVLSAAGEHRLLAKARRLAATLALRPLARLQVFYEEVMTALGYKRNARGFRRVAEAVPYDRIVAEPENAAPALLGAAGFVDWNRLGLRPSNRPEARLRAAAAIFTRTGIAELAEADSFAAPDCRAMLRELTRDRLMGRGRAAAILANVVVPFALARGAVGRVPSWLPPEDLSEPVHLTAFRMFGRDHNPAAFYARNGRHIQGLIQIHRDFCLQVHPDCDGCTLIDGPG